MTDKKTLASHGDGSGKKFRSVVSAVYWYAYFLFHGGRSISIPTIIPKKGGSAIPNAVHDFNGDVAMGEQAATALRIHAAMISAIDCGYISQAQVAQIMAEASKYVRFVEAESLYNSSEANKLASKNQKNIVEKRRMIRLSVIQLGMAHKVYQFRSRPEYSTIKEAMTARVCKKMKFSFLDFGLLVE